jgi:hypothetical protein
MSVARIACHTLLPQQNPAQVLLEELPTAARLERGQDLSILPFLVLDLNPQNTLFGS